MSQELLAKLRAELDASKELAPVHRADAGIEAIYNFIVAVSAGPAEVGIPTEMVPSTEQGQSGPDGQGQAVEGPVAFLGVDYDEFKPETYRCVFVRTQDGQGREANAPFYSGVFVDDLHRAQEFLASFQGHKFELSSYHNYLADIAKLEGKQEASQGGN